MKIYLNLLGFAFLLTACATAETIRGPDGTSHQYISCVETTSCYDKAAEVCKGTYKIVNSTEGWESRGTNLLVKCEQKGK